MHRNSENVSTKQERIAALAKQSPEMAFTSLAYLMDIDWLKEAYRRTRKDGAVGEDGVTAEDYEQDFLDCSYGFRPRRSAHDALKSFPDQTMNSRPLGGWVLEVVTEILRSTFVLHAQR